NGDGSEGAIAVQVERDFLKCSFPVPPDAFRLTQRREGAREGTTTYGDSTNSPASSNPLPNFASFFAPLRLCVSQVMVATGKKRATSKRASERRLTLGRCASEGRRTISGCSTRPGSSGGGASCGISTAGLPRKHGGFSSPGSAA